MRSHGGAAFLSSGQYPHRQRLPRGGLPKEFRHGAHRPRIRQGHAHRARRRHVGRPRARPERARIALHRRRRIRFRVPHLGRRALLHRYRPGEDRLRALVPPCLPARGGQAARRRVLHDPLVPRGYRGRALGIPHLPHPRHGEEHRCRDRAAHVSRRPPGPLDRGRLGDHRRHHRRRRARLRNLERAGR